MVLCVAVQVSLEDLYNGKMSKLAVQRNIICDECNGKGGKEVYTKSSYESLFLICVATLTPCAFSSAQGAVRRCGACNGQGVVVSASNLHHT